MPAAAVIGAGPAGLAAAHTLVQRGWRVDVYERDNHLGGMARSLDLWGETVDAGPHLLAGGDPAACALWAQVAGETRSLPLRRAMFRHARFIQYPPTAAGLARALSARELASAVAAALHARLRPQTHSDDHARGWFINRYGRPLYEIMLRSYFAKLWGADGDAIEASYLSTVSRTAEDLSEVPTARRELLYPVTGLGAAWSRLASRLAPHGQVLLRTTAREIVVQDGAVAGVDCGSGSRRYDAVISAAPIGALLRMLPRVPADAMSALSQLQARHMVLVHLRVRSSDSIRFAWVFIENPRLALCRVSDSRFWRGTPRERLGTLTLEYWCGSGDPVWSEDDAQLQGRAVSELHEAGVLRDASVEAAHIMRLPRALPVPALGHRRTREPITRYLSGIQGLYTIGRHGTFELDSTLSAMANGIATADRADRDRVTRTVPSAAAPDARRLSVVP